MSNDAVSGTTMARTVGSIRKSFDAADRMNCRDILDLIEAIDFMRDKLRAIQRETGSPIVERWAREALRVSA